MTILTEFSRENREENRGGYREKRKGKQSHTQAADTQAASHTQAADTHTNVSRTIAKEKEFTLRESAISTDPKGGQHGRFVAGSH